MPDKLFLILNPLRHLFITFIVVFSSLASADYKDEFKKYQGYAKSNFETFDDKIQSSLERMIRATNATSYSGRAFMNLEAAHQYWRKGGNGGWVGQAEIYAKKDDNIRRLLDWYYAGLDSIVSNYKDNFEIISTDYIRTEYGRFVKSRKKIFAAYQQADHKFDREGEADRAEYRKRKMTEAVDNAIANISFSGGTPPDILSEIRESLTSLKPFGSNFASPGTAPSYVE